MNGFCCLLCGRVGYQPAVWVPLASCATLSHGAAATRVPLSTPSSSRQSIATTYVPHPQLRVCTNATCLPQVNELEVLRLQLQKEAPIPLLQPLQEDCERLEQLVQGLIAVQVGGEDGGRASGREGGCMK
jgi:hypothetical protein